MHEATLEERVTVLEEAVARAAKGPQCLQACCRLAGPRDRFNEGRTGL